MIEAFKKIIRQNIYPAPEREKGSAEAYDLWARQYDAQPGNLMLDMDEAVFSALLDHFDAENRQIADIGCGTGRHWDKILRKHPLGLTGFDVSSGMLRQLKEKFPQAPTFKITNNLFSSIPDRTYDAIVSTLTVAHIENIAEALEAWCRILKKNADIIITDFHPDALAIGGKRTFGHRNMQITVRNFVHYVHSIEEILLKQGFHIIQKEERTVDETVKHYYTAKNALHVYDKFKNSRIIYGIHLRRRQQ